MRIMAGAAITPYDFGVSLMSGILLKPGLHLGMATETDSLVILAN